MDKQTDIAILPLSVWWSMLWIVSVSQYTTICHWLARNEWDSIRKIGNPLNTGGIGGKCTFIQDKIFVNKKNCKLTCVAQKDPWSPKSSVVRRSRWWRCILRQMLVGHLHDTSILPLSLTARVEFIEDGPILAFIRYSHTLKWLYKPPYSAKNLDLDEMQIPTFSVHSDHDL